MFVQKLVVLVVFLFKFSHLKPLENDDSSKEPDLAYLGTSVYKKPDENVGKKVENWEETADINPEELGEYAEGDILFPSVGKNGLIASTSRWKDGVIPYEISSSIAGSNRDMIMRAINIYHKYTCISFRKRTSSDTDYISIVNNPTGCWSSVGRIGGKQEVNLQSPSCSTKVGTPLHELMHAIGFLHEQNRYERDDFVDIAWQNIKKGHEANFNKANKDTTDALGVPYDFRSVMHYSSYAFSTNGRQTIIPKDSQKGAKMGQRDGFSKGDLIKINKMYNCPEKTDAFINNNNNNNNVDANNNNSISSENKENSNLLANAAGSILNFLFH